MGKGKTKFQESWLDKEFDGVFLKEWLQAVNGDIYSAKCILCSETFWISNSGIKQVEAHHKGKKHLLKFNNRFKNQCIFSNVKQKSSGDESLSHQNKVVKAEALWALHVADRNISFRSCTETVDLFKVMFPDSPIAAAMQLKEKKTAYVITHGIAKHFEKNLVEDITKSTTKITLGFDESTNVQNKCQLDMYCRYWSNEFNLVNTSYLKSVFLGHATADIIVKELLDTLSAFNIPLEKVICLSMDNPNVNKSVYKKFSEALGENSLLPIGTGTCNLHVANNAFKVFLDALELNFDEFSNDVFFFLKNSAVRREDFKCMEEVTQEAAQFLLKHVNSRWLSAGPVAQRLVEQWANLSEYFLNFLPKQKMLEKQLNGSSRYKRIRENLQEPSTLCFLAVIAYTHKCFESFSLCFQSEAPRVHILFSEMNKLIRQVMIQFIQDDIVAAKEGTELRDVDVDDSKNWKKLNLIEIGMSAKGFLSSLSDNKKKSFLLNVRSALKKTVSYLMSNLPYCDQFFKDLELFCPGKTLSSNSVYGITRIARYLNFTDNVIDSMREEWKLFIFDTEAHEKLSSELSKAETRIDEYWRELFSMKNNCNSLKYLNLANLIKTVFILPHGNSDPERGFSINKAMVDANHSENTIISLRLVKDRIRKYGGVLKVPITISLIKAVQESHKLYQEHQRSLKEEEEKLQKIKKQMEKEMLEKEESRKRKNDLDSQIAENNKKINELKRNKELALGLIKEGTERLAKAAVAQNAVEISVSQSLITEGTNQLQKYESELSVLETDKEKVLKKRLKMN